VEKYLDDVFMAGVETVTIIHGRGEGILKKGIHDLLKKSRRVESFRKGGYNEGGDGVTIVTMKK
jgi:Mismatch repair ATPase (MutS family)